MHLASYSRAKATLNNIVAQPSSIRRSNSADAPRGLRIAAGTTLVSSRILT
jgi:hypothetical protein